MTDRALILAGARLAKTFMPPIAQPGVAQAQIRRLAGFNIFETVILPDNVKPKRGEQFGGCEPRCWKCRGFSYPDKRVCGGGIRGSG